MQLSVIIPAFQAAPFLNDCLAPLLAELPPDCEVIVVDDASTDATSTLAAAHAAVRTLRHLTNRGVGAARNTGAAAARGELLLFLDADTIPTPGLVSKVIADFAANPALDAASGRYADRNPGSADRPFARYLDACEAEMRAPALDRPAPGSLSGNLCAIRRAVFCRLGGFSENRRQAIEDIELGLRLSRAGYQHQLLDDWVVGHRQPDLGHYLRELIPRTRHYIALLAHYRTGNEMMGGSAEGWSRLTVALAGLALLALACLPSAPLALAAAGASALALWRNRLLLRRLSRQEGPAFLPRAAGYHLLSTTAICLGGSLGVFDRLQRTARRGLIDLAVCAAYLKSLLDRHAPGYLILYLTHRCNARCRHCFDHPQRAAIGQASELELPRLRQLAASSGAVGHLSLTGGEPLLRKDLPEIFTAWYAAGVRSFSLSTNGGYPAALAEAIPRMLANAPHARLIVTLSIDALGQRHDALRLCPGLFDKVEESLSRLQSLRLDWPQLRIHGCLTLTAGNAADCEQTLDWMRRWQFDQVELNALRGLPDDRGLPPATAEHYARARQQVAALNGSTPGLAWLFSGLDRAMFGIVSRWREPWPCGTCLAGRRLVVIHADGTVLPCEMLRTMRPHDASRLDNFVLGRLGEHQDRLPTLLAAPAATRLRQYIADTDCRCSFECAIFATISYRPWRLWRLLARPAGTPAARPLAKKDPC